MWESGVLEKLGREKTSKCRTVTAKSLKVTLAVGTLKRGVLGAKLRTCPCGSRLQVASPYAQSSIQPPKFKTLDAIHSFCRRALRVPRPSLPKGKPSSGSSDRSIYDQVQIAFPLSRRDLNDISLAPLKFNQLQALTMPPFPSGSFVQAIRESSRSLRERAQISVGARLLP